MLQAQCPLEHQLGLQQNMEVAMSWYCRSHTPDVTGEKQHINCTVCWMETHWAKQAGQANANAGLLAKVSICSECGIATHAVELGNRKRCIHDLEEFWGMTCFEGMHSTACEPIWMPTATSKESANHSTPVVKRLRISCGLRAEIKHPKIADDSDKKQMIYLTCSFCGLA
jgi:hypothetical protein